MNKHARLALTATLVLAGAIDARGADIRLETDQPGNLFGFGRPVSIDVKLGGEGELAWRVTDLDEKEVKAGSASVPEAGRAIGIEDLPYGYYELHASSAGETATLSFGVVADKSAEAPPSGRLNIDGATAWLEKEGRHDELARMLRRVGIGWVRERFSWSSTEVERGKFRWPPYDEVADAFAKHGVRVYQLFHDSPRWSHPEDADTRNPRDLRDAYRFAKRLAERYRGKVRAWEVWNEPDIFFWPDLGDTFAGLQKAAYLGFKAGDPELPVLLGSLCRGVCAFDENLFETGVGEYYDIFNWHVYAPPADYPDTLGRYLELLDRYGEGGRPVWLTEAGIRLNATEPGGELNEPDERRQADFVPKSFALSLAAGTDRHFFFVFPYYLERGVQFGALRKDLSPRPSFIAIAAAVDILGEARYLGRYEHPGGGPCTALSFASGDERVLVIWSEAEQEVTLDVAAAEVTLADVVGRRQARRTESGKLTLGIRSGPQYVIGVGQAFVDKLSGPRRAPGKLRGTQPHPVVVRGQALVSTIDKGANCYLIVEESFSYLVEVCNLDERKRAKGSVRFEAPAGWKVEPTAMQIDLEPMGRATRELVVTPGAPARGTHKLWIRCELEDSVPKPSVSYFRFDLARISPTESFALELDDPARWQKNISGNGAMTIHAAEGGGARFEIEFKAPGDRWCYPVVDFAEPQDFSKFDGVAFDYRCHGEDDSSAVRLQVVEPNGAVYYTTGDWKAKKTWTRATALFESLAWGSFSAKDPDGKLDTKAIRTLRVGINTPRDKATLEVRNVRLVKLAGE